MDEILHSALSQQASTFFFSFTDPSFVSSLCLSFVWLLEASLSLDETLQPLF